MNEWMVNLIQSSCVNVKIAGVREPRLVFMLFISFNEKITFCQWEQLNMRGWTLFEVTVSRYNIFKRRNFEGANEGTACALDSENTSTAGHVVAAQGVCKGDLAAWPQAAKPQDRHM